MALRLQCEHWSFKYEFIYYNSSAGTDPIGSEKHLLFIEMHKLEGWSLSQLTLVGERERGL